MTARFAVALLLLWCPAAFAGEGRDAAGQATEPASYKQTAGPYPVQTQRFDWTDDARAGQPVPAKLYLPQGAGPFPVVLFSHGLGGSRDHYEYLGRHWASLGYACLHLQHVGSDSALWQGQARPMEAMRQSIRDPRNAIERPRDVGFAIDQLTMLNKENPKLQGRFDLERIGVAGHSFGAYTANAVAGQAFVGPAGRRTLRDPRVKAVIPMSSPIPPRGNLDDAFGGITLPALHMTGTLDASIIGDTAVERRRLAYDHSPGPDKYLVIFDGGDHMVFSGSGRLPGRDAGKDPMFQDLIAQITTAFWDAYLREDETAKAWLRDGGCATLLGECGVFESK